MTSRDGKPVNDSHTDTPESTTASAPSQAERAARAAEAMRAAEAAGLAASEAAAKQATGPRGGQAPGGGAPPPPEAGPTAQEGLAALTGLFAETGVPAPFAARTAARLGSGAAGLLRADPWRLLRVPGVLPRQADHFARRLLGPDARPDDPRRGRALVAYLLTEAAREGHTVTPAADVLTALERLQVADTNGAVEAALDEADVLELTEEPEFDEEAFEEDAEPPEPERTLGLARWALAEDAAAEGFQRLTLTAAPLLEDAEIKSLRSGLPEDRSLALTAALRTGVGILRGAPGQVERTALDLAAAAAGQGVRVAVVTPTDRTAADLAATLPDDLVTSTVNLVPGLADGAQNGTATATEHAPGHRPAPLLDNGEASSTSDAGETGNADETTDAGNAGNAAETGETGGASGAGGADGAGAGSAGSAAETGSTSSTGNTGDAGNVAETGGAGGMGSASDAGNVAEIGGRSLINI
ncbi:helix-hairpin-helix domain-containing protein [Actinomadura rubrisoli]|uniref:helix-hairpin-helix domain-containing protein n=1 Tax=Actinomadura rubrisoli TaxID=2530368 RepID=UPI001FB5DED7|nr:helix-hairpin-helix domain-containing protein [Actinomadura rubrisoli]